MDTLIFFLYNARGIECLDLNFHVTDFVLHRENLKKGNVRLGSWEKLIRKFLCHKGNMTYSLKDRKYEWEDEVQKLSCF